jgi:LysR family transcriptional regulator, hydrogen peroxide-inducible genes activator
VPRPSVRQLEYAVAVADHRSFRRAAAASGITQPALSAQIAQLERDLGAQIFERDRRRVLVTPAGEEVLGHARRILGALDDLVDGAGSHREPLTGTVRLGVIPTVAPYLLPAGLPAVRARHPRLKLILREDQTARLLAELDAGRIDAALLALPVPGDLAAIELYREEFLLAAPDGHPLLGRRRVRQDDLDGETTLLLEDGHCLRDQALAVCQAAGAREAAELRATSLPTLVQMVAGGLGVTLLPESAAAVLAGRRGGVGLRRLAEHPGRSIGLVWRMSSARGPEFGLLAAAIGDAATRHLAAIRARSPSSR